jgi:predicted amidohydrolase
MKLALAQTSQTAGDVSGNVDRAERAVRAAAADGADLVALPELFAVGYFAFDSYAREAEGLTGPTVSRFQDLADELDVGILAGSIVEDLESSATEGIDVPAADGLANTSVFVDRNGDRRAIYRKQHLFGYGSAETRLLTAGESLPVFEFDEFSVGMTTCYDLRFPDMYHQLADRGATLVLVPSAWPYPRVEHWRVLPRARAIENSMFVGAVNGSATFEETTLLGRSTVYDPWGTPLASAGDDPAVVTATLDPDTVERVREEFPSWRDRR